MHHSMQAILTPGGGNLEAFERRDDSTDRHRAAGAGKQDADTGKRDATEGKFEAIDGNNNTVAGDAARRFTMGR